MKGIHPIKKSVQSVVRIPSTGTGATDYMDTLQAPVQTSQALINNYYEPVDVQWVTLPASVGQVSNVAGSNESAIRELSMSIAGLRNDIQELTKAIKATLPSAEDILIFRDISKDEATKEISELMQCTQHEMYPSDISTQLKIDYDLVVEVLNDLSAAGKIE